MIINTTITNDQQPIQVEGVPDNIVSQTGGLNTQGNTLMNVTEFRNQFPTMDGRGYSVAVIDTGINTNHPAFAGRIVAQKDFGNNDDDATDVNGHGTNVSSIIGSSNPSYLGVAPGVNIIALKVFTNSGSGTMSRIEKALRWVINNAATYNIVSINMSVSDGMNHNSNSLLYGLNDELNILANQMQIIPVAASGNSFYPYNSQQGVGYPASDPNSLAVGAVFDSNVGRLVGAGAIAETSGPDIITPFSQRDKDLTTVMAPGVKILGAAKTTSTGSNTGAQAYSGTSQASPQIAGVIALAQQFAEQTLGRRLSYDEIIGLLQSSGRTVNDGDDENDNVINTGLNFKRVDMMALAQSIQNMSPDRGLKINVNLTNPTRQVQEYGGGFGLASITDYTTNVVKPNRTELNIMGNTWLQVPLKYTVTPNTLLSFDFKSNNIGNVHGIGFDTDTNYANTDANQGFKLYGTQFWGRNNYQYTTPGNWQSFTIRAGKFFTGDFNHLFFANRHKVTNPTGTSDYNNIRIYERSFPKLKINVNGTNNIGQMQEYGNNLGIATITDYNAATVGTNQTELNISGNTWLQVPLNYTVTPNTLLSFDFKSNNIGNIHGIGFDTDTNYANTDVNQGFKLYGTQFWGRNNYQYTTPGNWQSFQIPVGRLLTGEFNHLFFANRHNVTVPTATSNYNNIRISERPSPDLTISVNGRNSTQKVREYGLSQGVATITDYTTTVENDTLLNITGNSWLQVALNYTVTANTLLKFDFKSNNRGNIHGIGFDTDTKYADTDANQGFKLYGTQSWGRNNYQYTNVGNWQSFQIRVGTFFRGEFDNLFFANRHSIAAPTATSQFKGIEIMEQIPQQI